MRDPAVPIDGRTARAARTRSAIVDATVALVEEGDLRPTAPRIAQRAGVSVRSVFQHFDDLPTLYTAVVQRVYERLAVLVAPIDATLPLADRIDTFVRQRAALLEAVTPFRRAAAVHGPFAVEIRRATAKGGAFLRAEVEATFAAELGRTPGRGRRELLDALAATCSWGVWEALRTEAGASAEHARAVMGRTVRALLAARAPGV